MSATAPSPAPLPSLGLDAGGTGTRWALANAQGLVLREGMAPAFSGAGMPEPALQAAWAALSQAVGPVRGVVAGITGLGDAPALAAQLAAALGVPAACARAFSDVELAARAAFAPGQGILVYAGTGSVAAHIDEAGTLHRAGGRGAVIDDAGGGHWIARQALGQVWRAEDAEPGAWRRSLMAQALFERIGGADWARCREWVYGASRGELGTLALAVAQAAQAGDAQAQALLEQAGPELARLALALMQRVGPHPVALDGRVFDLSPAIESSLRAALPAGTAVHRSTQPAHHAAARLAAALPDKAPA